MLLFTTALVKLSGVIEHHFFVGLLPVSQFMTLQACLAEWVRSILVTDSIQCSFG